MYRVRRVWRLNLLTFDETLYRTRSSLSSFLSRSLGLRGSGNKVMYTLLDMWYGKGVNPSPREVAEVVGTSYEAVRRFLEYLERIGFVERKRGVVEPSSPPFGGTPVDNVYYYLREWRDVTNKAYERARELFS